MALINKKQEYQDQEAWSDNVQKLKGYKEFKENVEYWAKQRNARADLVIKGSYEIVYDDKLGWCVDVDGDVSFYRLKIEYIPFQFRNVIGFFSCYDCTKLTSLKGCPVYVGGWFNCSGCANITSLEYCPKEINGDFLCDGCGKFFTEGYVRSLCNTEGNVY